jgi:hypothetical protein
MKEVYRTQALEEAQVLCALLREHDIDPLLDGENSGPVTLGLYTPAAPLLIQVRDEDEAAATEILDAVVRERANEVVFETAADAPTSTPEEEARFREQLRRSTSSRRKRLLWAGLLVLVPVPGILLLGLGCLVSGSSEAGLHAILTALALGVPALLIHRMARRSPRPKPPGPT